MKSLKGKRRGRDDRFPPFCRGIERASADQLTETYGRRNNVSVEGSPLL